MFSFLLIFYGIPAAFIAAAPEPIPSLAFTSFLILAVVGFILAMIGRDKNGRQTTRVNMTAAIVSWVVPFFVVGFSAHWMLLTGVGLAVITCGFLATIPPLHFPSLEERRVSEERNKKRRFW